MVSMWRRRCSRATLAAPKLTAGGLDLAAAGFQFLRHAVERMHQIADFIRSADFHTVVEPPARNFLRSFGKCDHWTRHQLGKKQGEPGGGEKHHHGEQKQHFHVGSPNQSSLAAPGRDNAAGWPRPVSRFRRTVFGKGMPTRIKPSLPTGALPRMYSVCSQVKGVGVSDFASFQGNLALSVTAMEQVRQN